MGLDYGRLRRGEGGIKCQKIDNVILCERPLTTKTRAVTIPCNTCSDNNSK